MSQTSKFGRHLSQGKRVMDIEAETAELVALERILLHGQITAAVVDKAKKREFN